jgi:hypothetical protein
VAVLQVLTHWSHPEAHRGSFVMVHGAQGVQHVPDNRLGGAKDAHLGDVSRCPWVKGNQAIMSPGDPVGVGGGHVGD